MNSFFLLNSSSDISSNENYAGFVVFYAKSKDESIAEIQSNLFSKLIENALKLSLDNFLFIDVTLKKERFSIISKTISIKKCLMFGVNESQIGINFDVPLYKLVKVSNIDFLRVDTPEAIEKDKNLKNKLWQQLQTAFKRD